MPNVDLAAPASNSFLLRIVSQKLKVLPVENSTLSKIHPISDDGFEERLARSDTTLFEPISISASPEDQRSLLALHQVVRHPGYSYLEIGSEHGGSLQTHLADPWCSTVFSIDLRVGNVPDVRGSVFSYHGVTTARMIDGLSQHYATSLSKLRTFDFPASEVPVEAIVPAPSLVFIDGEHTNKAVQEDFAVCRRFIASGGLIAFHDAQLVHQGIRGCLKTLKREGRNFHAVGLAGAVFVVAIGADAQERLSRIKIAQVDSAEFFLDAPAYLRQARKELHPSRIRLFLRRCRQYLFS